MERDNFEISQELEQMRDQFRLLSEKVEKQNIVNEKHLAASIENKVSQYSFSRKSWAGVLVLLYATYFNIDYSIKYDFPIWITIFFGGFCILNIVMMLMNIFKQRKDLDFKGDVTEFAVKVKSVKKFHIITFIIARIAGYTMLITFLNYYWGHSQTSSGNGNFIYIVVMVIVFCAIAVKKEIQKIRILDDILNEIEE